MPFTAPPVHTFRTAWKGWWLLAVAAIHTMFAAVEFLPQLQAMLQRGVIDSVGTDPMAGAVAWFVLFGAVLALLGWAMLLMEQHMAPGALRPLGLGVLALALLGIALMPASGFWLVLPPALAWCWGPVRRPAKA